jgi:hypothetical protein
MEALHDEQPLPRPHEPNTPRLLNHELIRLGERKAAGQLLSLPLERSELGPTCFHLVSGVQIGTHGVDVRERDHTDDRNGKPAEKWRTALSTGAGHGASQFDRPGLPPSSMVARQLRTDHLGRILVRGVRVYSVAARGPHASI